jgi:hypothetical protein
MHRNGCHEHLVPQALIIRGPPWRLFVSCAVQESEEVRIHQCNAGLFRFIQASLRLLTLRMRVFPSCASLLVLLPCHVECPFDMAKVLCDVPMLACQMVTLRTQHSEPR